jgi:hypothetical protein
MVAGSAMGQRRGSGQYGRARLTRQGECVLRITWGAGVRAGRCNCRRECNDSRASVRQREMQQADTVMGCRRCAAALSAEDSLE